MTGVESHASLSVRTMSEWPVASLRQVALHIRQYYYDRVDLLRQIPYLALEVNGRRGFSDILERAYSSLKLPVHLCVEGYDMDVELRTGVLISRQLASGQAGIFPALSEDVMASIGLPSVLREGIAADEDVLLLATNRHDFMFASGVGSNCNIEECLASLKEQTRIPYSLPHYTEEKAAKDKTAMRLSLDSMFGQIPIEKVRLLQQKVNELAAKLPFPR